MTISERLKYPFLILCAILGYIHYWHSDSFEGYGYWMVLMMALVFLVAPTGLFLIIASLIRGQASGLSAGVGGFAIIFIVFWISMSKNQQAISESKELGDELAGYIQEYRGKYGYYPTRLSKLREAGYEVPTPAIKDREFHYKVFKGRPYLQFDSVGSDTCDRDFITGTWRCDD